MFCLLSFLASSTIYSVDIGTDTIRVAFAGNDGMFSVQYTPYNKRFNPNAIAFGVNDSESAIYNHRWYTGSDAYVIYEQNQSRFVENPFNYLTHPKDFPLPGIHPTIASAIVVGANLPELVPKADKVIVTIPSTATPQYRFSLKDVMSLLNVKKLSFIERNTAVAVSYIVERLNRTIKTPTNVMIIDVGAEETEISHWRFSTRNTIINADLVNFQSTKKVSGKKLDEIFYKKLLEKLRKTESELTSEKINHLKRFSKMKKELFSFSENVTINLTNEFGVDSEFNITSEEIGNEISQILLSIVQTFKTPDRIELVGGVSRFPLFNTTISAFYEDIPVARSLSPDECATMGATYYEAIQSRILFGLKLNITKNSSFGFTIQKGEKSASLVEPGTKLGKRVISLQSDQDFSIQLKANIGKNIQYKTTSENINNEFDESFLTINVQGITKLAQTEGIKSSNFIINATFDYDKSFENFDLTSLKTSNFVNGKEKFWSLGYEEYLTDESMSIPQKTEKIVSSALPTLKNAAKKPTIAQKLLQHIYETLYRIKYDSCFNLVTTEDDRINLTAYLSEARNNLSKIAQNPKEIKSMLARIEKRLRNELLRADERRDRPNAIAALQMAIEKAEESLPTATTDETTIARFTEYFNITTIWKLVAEEVEPLTNPVILCKDIYRRANTLMNKIPELYGPKRHVTHFRTAPPMTPEAEKPKDEVNQTETNETTANETLTAVVNETEAASESSTNTEAKDETINEKNRENAANTEL